MLAIEIHLLAGRYGATAYNVRSEAEWPPHPGRLFSALVHAWADADEPDPMERDALRWLENQSPPHIVCDGEQGVSRRSAVTVYVPGNDPSSLADPAVRQRKADARHLAEERLRLDPSSTNRTKAAKALAEYRRALAASAEASPRTPLAETEVLPELRNRQPRQFPTVRPLDPRFCFVWPEASPDAEVRDALDRLLARVPRLGHSATQVACRVTTEPGGPGTFVAGPGGGLFLRVPRPGLLDKLERDFARHQGTRERQMPAALTEYGPPRRQPEPVPRGVLAGDWIVLALENGPGTAVGLPRALDLTRAVRDALVDAHPAAEEFLTGRFADGHGRPHLAVVPLADVGHRWASGLVRGIALVVPRDTDTADRSALHEALGRWSATGRRTSANGGPPICVGPPILAPADDIPGAIVLWDDIPHALRRPTWCTSARRWNSVTPVALDARVPDLDRPGSRGEGAERRAIELVVRACRFAGLPEPADVVISPTPFLAGLPRAAGSDRRRAFPPFRAGQSGVVRQSVHVSLTFDRRVGGPVLLGAGRYLGRGLFLPDREG